jgi:hypothetical protein
MGEKNPLNEKPCWWHAPLSAAVYGSANGRRALRPSAPSRSSSRLRPFSSARVVVVVLSDHLDRSERLLVELKHADAENTALASPLRDEARSL